MKASSEGFVSIITSHQITAKKLYKNLEFCPHDIYCVKTPVIIIMQYSNSPEVLIFLEVTMEP
jgi:hypothetical protein